MVDLAGVVVLLRCVVGVAVGGASLRELLRQLLGVELVPNAAVDVGAAVVVAAGARDGLQRGVDEAARRRLEDRDRLRPCPSRTPVNRARWEGGRPGREGGGARPSGRSPVSRARWVGAEGGGARPSGRSRFFSISPTREARAVKEPDPEALPVTFTTRGTSAISAGSAPAQQSCSPPPEPKSEKAGGTTGIFSIWSPPHPGGAPRRRGPRRAHAAPPLQRTGRAGRPPPGRPAAPAQGSEL